LQANSLRIVEFVQRSVLCQFGVCTHRLQFLDCRGGVEGFHQNGEVIHVRLLAGNRVVEPEGGFAGIKPRLRRISLMAYYIT